jgi:hypothetical protein
MVNLLRVVVLRRRRQVGMEMGIRLMVVMVLHQMTAVMDLIPVTVAMMDLIPTTDLPQMTAATATATPPAPPHHSQLPRATTKPTRTGTGNTTTRTHFTGRDPTGRLGHGLVLTMVRVPDTLCGIPRARRHVRCRRRRVRCIRGGIPRVRVLRVAPELIMEVDML